MRLSLVLLAVAVASACSGGGGMTMDSGSSDAGGGSYDAGPLPRDYGAVGYAVTIQSSKVVVVGMGGATDDPLRPDWFVGRFNLDGTVDATLSTRGFVDYDFDGGTGAQPNVDDGATVTMADGDKIVAAGFARAIPTTLTGTIAIARFNADGTYDTTFNGAGRALFDFNPGSVTANVGAAYALGKRADGKYVMAGGFDNGPTRMNDMFVYRLNTDGSVDGTFTPAMLHNGGSEVANDLVVQNLNVVLGGGESFATCRVTDTGALDMSFGVMGWSTSPGTSYKLLARGDGRLLSVGLRSVATDRIALKLYQTSADGVADATFGTTGVVELGGMNMGPEGEVRGAALASDGSLYVLTNSLRGANVVKIRSDGTLDTAWGMGGERPSGMRISILTLLTSLPRGANALTLNGGDVWVTGTTLVEVNPGSTVARFAVMKVGP